MSNTAVAWPEAPIAPRTLELLGGEKVVVVRKRARGGARPLQLKFAAVERLSDFYAESPTALLGRLHVNERTALRRRERGALSVEESDRIARLARVTRRAIDAFGNDVQARAWLTRPNRALGAIPFALLASDAGAELVTHELGRIEHGDLF